MKILIAVEGNNFSKESLGPAIRFASRAKAEIHLLSIFTKDDTHITWKRNHVAEGASHHFLDASGSLPQELPAQGLIPVQCAAHRPTAPASG